MDDRRARIGSFLGRLIAAAEARPPIGSGSFILAEPMLIAIGGLAGSGKSTLAQRLAPYIGHPPGALHVRSDQLRKALAGVGDLDRLPADSYTREASQVVYEAVNTTAEAALAAGWSVVVDTVAARASERAAFAAIAREHRARFIGLWLTAPKPVLIARVSARIGDASDADASVVIAQSRYETGDIDWKRIDAGGSPEVTFERVLDAIGR